MATWDGELHEIESLVGALRDTVDDIRRRLQMIESKIVTLEQQQGLMLKEAAKRRQL